jgi:hypothetical protein
MIADSDYNIIKPVESLPHSSSLTPVKRREQRKRKQQPDGQGDEEPQQQLNEPAPQEDVDQHDDNHHSIDYCA